MRQIPGISKGTDKNSKVTLKKGYEFTSRLLKIGAEPQEHISSVEGNLSDCFHGSKSLLVQVFSNVQKIDGKIFCHSSVL